MRNLLNVTAHKLGQVSGWDSPRHNQSCTKRARHDKNICSSSSKGVVALLSGHWAAQIYVNHNWIWLGIFKTEKEAVMAYETTSIKLCFELLNKNLKRTSNAAQETNLQKQDSIEAALSRIDDGTHSSSSVNILQVQGNQKCIRTQLFEKVLTPSDVGRLNRLVIPKSHVSCFPCIFDENESRSEVRPVELGFYDRSMNLWSFRYCYWKSSNTYVFSKGWRSFVREKQLSSKDKVIFYKCECVEATFAVHMYYMIDFEYYANVVQVEEVGCNMGENSEKGMLDEEQNGDVSSDIRHGFNIEADKEPEGNKSGKAPEKSFKLFGVKIA